MKVSRQPAAMPGHGLREIDLPEGEERPGAERARGAHVAGRDGLHHAVDRQQREGQLDVRHRQDGAEAREDHLEPLVDQHFQQVVQRTFAAQQHEPRRGAHQQRGPERQHDEDHQQVGACRRLGRQQIGDREAEDQRQHGDQPGDPEGAGIDVDEHRLIRRDALDPVGALLQVDRRQPVVGRVARGGALDDAPQREVAPDLVGGEEQLLVGAARGRLDLAGDALELRHRAGIFAVDALGDLADLALLLRGFQILGERGEGRLVRQTPGRPSPPAPHGCGRAGRRSPRSPRS